MKLAIVSPWPPAASGVADYAETIARALAAHFDIERLEQCAPKRLEAADRRLYQLGNNRLHGPAYDAALAVPGVVELHDAVLHHFLLGRLDRDAYIEEHVYNAGPWARARAEQLWERRGRSETDAGFFRYPLLKRIVQAAETVVVHNPAARKRVIASGVERPIAEIPHFVAPAPALTPEKVAETRARLGVADEAALIGCFGYQRPTKRLRSVARALRRVKAPYRLLVSGRFLSPDYEAALAPALEEVGAIRTPFVPGHELDRQIGACDICVNLRWPAAGETSGILMRAMAAGKAAVVTESDEVADLPPGTAARIDPGDNEEAMLAAMLERLAADRDLRESMGRHAAAYVRERHSLERAVAAYRQALS